MDSAKKHIKVAAALIIRDNNGSKEFFATQRGYGNYKDWWEFPGGKIEAGENAENAVVREIKEELNTTIRVEDKLCTVDYDYPEFYMTMTCFVCSVVEGKLELLEHENASWLNKDNYKDVKWLPADYLVFDKMEEVLA